MKPMSHLRLSPGSALAAAALTAALAVAAPGAAHADVATFGGSTVRIQGDDRAETIILSVSSTGSLRVNTDDAGPGCGWNVTHDEVECPLAAGGVVVDMRGGDDKVTSLKLTEGTLPDGSLQVDLGAGNDRFTGTDGREVVVGGPGNDILTSGPGNDSLDGGDGNDTLDGGSDADEVRGGAGDDVLDGGAFEAPAPDLIDGGPGTDRVEGWNIPDEDIHPPVSVTLNGVADDGRPGENDDVRDVERITSHVSGTFSTSDANDVIDVWANLDYGASRIATAGGDDVVTAGNASETIDGGAGNDRLEGGFGDDAIVGGPGRDTIIGDKSGGNCGLFESCSMPVGNDTIDVADGELDSVTCGVGTDTVTADAGDTVAPDCEQVTRVAAPAPPAPRPSPSRGGEEARGGARGASGARGGADHAVATLRAASAQKLRKALRKGVVVRVGGVKPGTRVALTARAGKRTVARGDARAGKGGSATVTLRFTKAARRSLRGKRRVVLAISGAGARTTLTLGR